MSNPINAAGKNNDTIINMRGKIKDMIGRHTRVKKRKVGTDEIVSPNATISLTIFETGSKPRNKKEKHIENIENKTRTIYEIIDAI